MTDTEVKHILRTARTERLFRRLTCTIHGHNWHDTAYGTAIRAAGLGIRPMPELSETWEEPREYCMRCGKTR